MKTYTKPYLHITVLKNYINQIFDKDKMKNILSLYSNFERESISYSNGKLQFNPNKYLHKY